MTEEGRQPAETGGQEEQLTSTLATPEVSEGRAAEPAGGPVDVEALRQEIQKQKQLANYHLDQWKRTAADLENYRKRVEKEREELVKFGQAAFITRLLPVLDDFDRAFQTLPAELNTLTWIEGLALIDRKLHLVLEQQGLKEIDALGKQFDPALHQAVLQEDNNAYPDGQVIAVLQKGYTLHDRVLRPAMVKVARNTHSDQTTEAGRSAPAADEQKEGESETVTRGGNI